jgi:cellulose synthase/poly-beta-1,6-N-acetylglucosamine synthase-like glycosyltransferase
MKQTKQSMPFVSIITPAKAEKDYIADCIDSLLGLDYPKSSYEIIIVLDKNATDDVKDVLKAYSKTMGLRVLQSKKAGSAANRNLGVSKANPKAKYYAFTDADCVVDKRWLKNLILRIQKGDADVVGGVNLVPESDNKLAKTIGAMEQTLFGGGGSAQSSLMKTERKVVSLPNCNALYKKRLWQENKQDESLITGQDGEFNYRLWRKGAKFLAIPDAKVWHHRTRSIKGFARRMFKYGEATAKTLKMHKDIDFLRIRWYGFLPVFAFFAFLILLGAVLFGNFHNSFYYFLVKCILIISIVFYSLSILVTAISVIARTGLAYSIISILLIPLQHLLYAVGFIKGIVR